MASSTRQGTGSLSSAIQQQHLDCPESDEGTDSVSKFCGHVAF